VTQRVSDMVRLQKVDSMPRPCGVVDSRRQLLKVADNHWNATPLRRGDSRSQLLKVANNHWDATRLPREVSRLSSSWVTKQET
jgi:hypothetical protein